MAENSESRVLCKAFEEQCSLWSSEPQEEGATSAPGHSRTQGAVLAVQPSQDFENFLFPSRTTNPQKLIMAENSESRVLCKAFEEQCSLGSSEPQEEGATSAPGPSGTQGVETEPGYDFKVHVAEMCEKLSAWVDMIGDTEDDMDSEYSMYMLCNKKNRKKDEDDEQQQREECCSMHNYFETPKCSIDRALEYYGNSDCFEKISYSSKDSHIVEKKPLEEDDDDDWFNIDSLNLNC